MDELDTNSTRAAKTESETEREKGRERGRRRRGDGWNGRIQEERELEGGSTAEREREIDVKWWVRREV